MSALQPGDPPRGEPALPDRQAPVALAVASRQFSIVKRQGAWRDALRRRMLALADAAGVGASCVLATVAGGVPLWSLAIVPLWLVLAKLYGLYDNDHRALRHLTVDELPTLVAWTTTGTALHMLLVALFAVDASTAADAAWLWVSIFASVPLLRAAARGLWRAVTPAERAFVVGSGPLEVATRRKLELFTDIHVRCVGQLDDQELGTSAAEVVAEQLRALKAAGSTADRVIVASTSVDERLIAGLVLLCRQTGLKLSVVPPARGMFGTAVQLHHIADLPMIEYSTWDVARSTLLMKRVIDVAVSSVLLVVTAPLLALMAIAVRIDSPGSSFFRQPRAGKGGKPFVMLKLRTMTADAETRLKEVIDLDELADPMFKLRRDPRVTTLGRLLRRTSFDELPQLWNVLRGDMSLVGPRPEQLSLVDRYEADHRFRLAISPGITGPMQVYGRGELRFDERLAVEREYVENLSLRRDLRILLLTVAAVARGKGAF